MTMTTVPTQDAAIEASADEIQILRPSPTIADAQLILQQQAIDATSGAYRGFLLLRDFEIPPTLGQLRKRYPIDSAEYEQVMALLISCETTATFVRQGILNEALVKDVYWIGGVWSSTEKIVKGSRRETGEPRLYENFEWLVKHS
jgi:hypothetical protein